MKFSKGTLISLITILAMVGFSTGDGCRIKAPKCDIGLDSFIGVDIADAKRSGGSSFGGSRSSRSYGGGSKSWGGSSKKSSSWGGSKKSSSNKASTFGSKKTSNKSSFSKKTNTGISKSKSSKAYKKHTSMKYANKPSSKLTSAPKTKARATNYYTKNSGRTYTSRNDYYRYRDTYYGGYSAPMYVGSMGYSSFGMWDVLWLSMLMDNMNDRNNARWMYNHQNDPGVQQYRAEMQTLSAENAEVKAQLAALDAEMAAMKGEPIDPNYMIDGVDPSVAMAPSLVEEKIPEEKSYTWLWVALILIVGVGLIVVFAW